MEIVILLLYLFLFCSSSYKIISFANAYCLIENDKETNEEIKSVVIVKYEDKYVDTLQNTLNTIYLSNEDQLSKNEKYEELLSPVKKEIDSIKQELEVMARERKKARIKAYYESNKDKIKASTKAWGEANPAKKKAYHFKNRDKRIADMKVYNKEYKSKLSKAELRAQRKTYRDANRPLLNAKSRAYNATHIQYRLSKLLRSRLFNALKRGWKSGSAVKDLGCTIPELQTYLESKFQSGMNWDNQGEWHIDHIKPLALFDLTDREQLLIACHYSNLQPLWATENIVKSDNWTD